MRQEPYSGRAQGAEGWLILYSSRSPGGDPVAVSGVVIAPADPPPGARPVVAYAHGTTGVATGCAPSLTDDPLFEMPVLAQTRGCGWAVVATDALDVTADPRRAARIAQNTPTGAIDARCSSPRAPTTGSSCPM